MTYLPIRIRTSKNIIIVKCNSYLFQSVVQSKLARLLKYRTMEQCIREKSCGKLAKSVDLWNLVHAVLANTHSNENTLRVSTSVTHENRHDVKAKESCSVNDSQQLFTI